MNGYKVDFTNNTITITADFAKAMQDPSSAAYKTIRQIQKDFPQMEIVKRSHHSPRKCTTKSGETFNCNQFKNLKYENMESFIKCLPNSETHLQNFNFLKDYAALIQTSGYTVVRRWFVAQFPEFRKNPLFYLTHEVPVVDITPFIQAAEEEKTAA